jgi:hypothetical protein
LSHRGLKGAGVNSYRICVITRIKILAFYRTAKLRFFAVTDKSGILFHVSPIKTT